MFLLLSAGRDRCALLDARVPDGGTEGANRTEAAVSRAASIWAGLSGLDLIATRSRLVSEGKCGGGRFSLAAATPAQMAAIVTSTPPIAPNAQNCP